MKKNYEVPEIEVIDVKIEKGFALTQIETPDDEGNF